jgi:hypothetical protein
MDWIDLAKSKNRWRALVNTTIILWVPNNFGKFFSASKACDFS